LSARTHFSADYQLRKSLTESGRVSHITAQRRRILVKRGGLGIKPLPSQEQDGRGYYYYYHYCADHDFG